MQGWPSKSVSKSPWLTLQAAFCTLSLACHLYSLFVQHGLLKIFFFVKGILYLVQAAMRAVWLQRCLE